MFNKKEIQDLKQIFSKELSDIKKSIDRNTKVVESLDLWPVEKAISDLKDKQSGVIKKTEASLNELNKQKQRFEKMINNLKHSVEKASEVSYNKLQDSIAGSVNRLNLDITAFNNLKKDIQSISNDVLQTKFELEKFNAIAKSLKERDFELSKYQKSLLQQDQEKLRLMKEVEGLRRLIAKERRRR